MKEITLNNYQTTNIFLIYFVLLLVGFYFILPAPAYGAADHSGKCEVTDRLSLLENIHITKIDTDGKSGMIHYTATSGNKGVLNLDKAIDGNMLPILALVDRNPVELKEMDDAQIRMIKTSKRECTFSHPVIGNKHLSDQWILQVQLVK